MKIFLTKIFSKKNDEKPVCPHCKGILTDKPTKKKKCSLCKKDIYVRTSPITKEKILVTESEAKKIDSDWESQGLANRWKSNLKQFGVTDKDYEQYKNELEAKFKHTPNDRDTIWSIFNKLLLIKHDNLHELKMLYYDMALFLNEEGKDFFKILQQAGIMELKQMQKDGYVEKVKILATPDSCSACRKQDGKVLTITDALKELPVPCNECSHIMDNGKRGFCRCLYNAEVEI